MNRGAAWLLVELPDIGSATNEELEEFVTKVLRCVASLKSVKIDRAHFLRSELKRRCPEINAELAIEKTPIEAGISPQELDRIAAELGVFRECSGDGNALLFMPKKWAISATRRRMASWETAKFSKPKANSCQGSEHTSWSSGFCITKPMVLADSSTLRVEDS